MGRPSRTGTAAPQRTIRIADSEWSTWMRAAHVKGHESVSAYVIKTMNTDAERVLSRVEARRGRSKR